MATAAEQVRSITGLSTVELTDDNIATLLELNDGNVRLAAADGLETLATSLLDVASDDITVSGSKRATILMARATRLREQSAADADDDGFTFDVVGGVACGPELTERRSCW